MTQHPKDLRIVTAANPSPMTGPGTNSFLIGSREIAVIDPGPDLPAHREAILRAAGHGRITHILVTHAHLDHSEGARALSEVTGAPVIGFGPPEAGRSALMQSLSRDDALSGGEGLDRSFSPDLVLRDGEAVESRDWMLKAMHTPGHFAGHLAFQWRDEVFCGDIVMGWSSTLISPPDGDLADYFRSLSRLNEAAPGRLWPAHGAPVTSPGARIAELAAHRRDRTAQILAALRDEPANAAQIAARIYDVPAPLQGAATRNVLAHLIALNELGAIRPLSPVAAGTTFAVG